MQDTLHFAQPYWIYVGVIVCVGLLLAFRSFERRRRAALARFASPGIMQRLLAGVSDPKRYLKRGLFVAGTALLFLALARPQLGIRWQEVKRRGIDIVFALDTSRSMLAEDVIPSRLERAKLGMVDFVDKIEGDRVGLIPFAGSAFTLCPLTLDYDAFHQSLDAANTDIIPHRGTDLASAIREAESLFAESGNNHKFLVLITDGEDLKGDALDAATQAAADGMQIFTVGVGSATGQLIPVAESHGQREFLKDASGQPVRSALDESMLKQIAQVTGAIYAPFGQRAEGLQTIYREKLSLVPKDELHQRMQQIAIERFEWPLAAALLCFVLRFMLGDRKRLVLRAGPVATSEPRPRSSVPATGLALLAAVGLCLAGASEASAESIDPRVIYNAATTAYQNGDFATAKAGLQAALATDDLGLQNRSYYNMGNALFREGSHLIQSKPDQTIALWDQSIKAYQGALALNPADADAEYNRDLVQKKLDALKQRQQHQQQEQREQEQQQQQSSDGEKSEDKSANADETTETTDAAEQESESSDPSAGNGGNQEESQQDGSDGDQPDQPASEETKNQGDTEPADTGKVESDEQRPNPNSAEPGESSDETPAPTGQTGTAAEAGDPREKAQELGETAAVGERRIAGEMTAREAAQLLDSLKDDEENVIFAPARQDSQFRDPNNTTNGKDW